MPDPAPTPARDGIALEDETVLDEDMHCSDLIWLLKRSHFDRNGFTTVKLDIEVVKYLIATLRQRQAAAP
jgi:hypothetical protein